MSTFDKMCLALAKITAYVIGGILLCFCLKLVWDVPQILLLIPACIVGACLLYGFCLWEEQNNDNRFNEEHLPEPRLRDNYDRPKNEWSIQ